MFERLFRLILAGAMFATLFMPTDPEVGPTWTFIFFYSLEVPLCAPFHLAVPTLILLNACLVAFPIKALRITYRTALAILFFLSWFGTLITVPPYRGIGFWAKPVVVSVAVLLEIVLVIKERLGESEGTGWKMT